MMKKANKHYALYLFVYSERKWSKLKKDKFNMKYTHTNISLSSKDHGFASISIIEWEPLVQQINLMVIFSIFFLVHSILCGEIIK